MSPEKILGIRRAVEFAAAAIKSELKPTDKHPARNPYAHIWRTIKESMGKTYKECSDDQYDQILDIIRGIVDDPDGFVPKRNFESSKEIC